MLDYRTVLIALLLIAAIAFMMKKAPNARKILAVLIGLIVVGAGVMYVTQMGPALLVKAPAEHRIAFISDHGGHADVWTMRLDGSDKRKVTDDPADERSPAWSPDAMEIAYVSDKSGDYDLLLAAWDGRYSHRMTTSLGTKDYPYWDAGGTRVMFISNGKVMTARRRGGQASSVLPPHGTVILGVPQWFTAPYAYAGISSDRGYVLCVQNTDFGRQAYALETPGGNTEHLDNAKQLGLTTARNLDAAWSPLSPRFAVAFIGREGVGGIRVYDVKMLTGRDLFTSESHGAASPAWSPDEGLIAFEYWTMVDHSPDKCLGIYTISSSGGEARPLVSGDAREPCWTIDGKYVIYTLHDKDGKRSVRRVNADGSNPVDLTEGHGDCHSPNCSPAVGRKS